MLGVALAQDQIGHVMWGCRKAGQEIKTGQGKVRTARSFSCWDVLGKAEVSCREWGVPGAERKHDELY